MADKRTTELSELLGVDFASADRFMVVDVSDLTMAATGTNKYLRKDELITSLQASLSFLTQAAGDARYSQLGHVHDAGDITSGILASTRGGTGNGFTKFSGPAGAEKTFTLPNASAVILTDNAAVTIAQGGTGQTTAAAAANALLPPQVGHANEFLKTDGAGVLSWAAPAGGGGGAPGGANTQVQFNDGGVFGGDADFTFDKATNLLSASNIKIPSTAAGAYSGAMLIGAYGTISETGGGLAYITGNSVKADAVDNQIIKTSGDSGHFMRMRYDKGISFHTVLSGAIGTTFADDAQQDCRIYGGTLRFGVAGADSQGIAKNATDILEVNSGTIGAYRDLRLRSVITDNGLVEVRAGGELRVGSSTDALRSLQANTRLGSTHMFGWSSGDPTALGGDLGLYRNAAGVLEINNETAGTFRDLKLRTVLAGTWNGTAIAAAYIGAHSHDAADITTGILAAARGGNGNGFFAVTGPATSVKTFTFPNSSQTILHDASAAGGDLAGTYPNPTIKASVSLTTPVIGVATGTSLAATGVITSSGTAGIGYATGAGGAVTQATSKATGVTLNKITGAITMNAAALAAATIVSFTLTNSTIAATDTVICEHQSGGTSAAYAINAFPAAGSAVISVRNNTAASLSEAIVVRFTVIKTVSA